jgi:hypothetical protein
VRPAKDDAWVTAEARQVTRYWNRYRQVLVTNYRDFVLVGQDAESNPAILETYRLAESEKAFWQAAATSRAAAEKQDDRFIEYLERVIRHGAPIAAPEDVAWFLASYAGGATQARFRPLGRSLCLARPGAADGRHCCSGFVGPDSQVPVHLQRLCGMLSSCKVVHAAAVRIECGACRRDCCQS